MKARSTLGLFICLAITPLGAAARAGGSVFVGANIGAAVPTGDSGLGTGGVWHLALGWSPNQSLALALEIGTAANSVDADRMVVWGGPREVTLHAVSTLGIVARRMLGTGRLNPYLAAGAGLYTAWDDLRATATRPAETRFRSGLGLQAGAGSGLRLSSHWDLYGEGLYHFATDAEDDARYFALQGGVRFHFGGRHTS